MITHDIGKTVKRLITKDRFAEYNNAYHSYIVKVHSKGWYSELISETQLKNLVVGAFERATGHIFKEAYKDMLKDLLTGELIFRK